MPENLCFLFKMFVCLCVSIVMPRRFLFSKKQAHANGGVCSYREIIRIDFAQEESRADILF